MMRSTASILVVMFAIALTGCIDYDAPGSGEVEECSAEQTHSSQVSVCNERGCFSYGHQASGYTNSHSYEWENPDDTAAVHWGSQISSGTLKLTIKDAQGSQVYSKTVSGTSQVGSSEATSDGGPGTWTIQLSFAAVTGQVGIEIESDC